MWNSKEKMTKREYLKCNQEVYDKQGRHINPGNTTVVNSHFGTIPFIGVANHSTETGNVAVFYDWY